MAQNLETLLVRIDASTEQLRRELKKADTAVAASGKKMDASLTKIDKRFDAFGKTLQRAFAAGVLYKVGKDAVMAADRYTVLQGRIREATRATGDYNAVSRELFAISQSTGTALANNVELFQRMGHGAREFGAANEDILKVTKTVQQLGVIGGSSASALAAGTTQFAQAMSAGVVRAEEWNSIVENIPELAVAIADSLGKSVGQVRQMVIDGKLLSEVVFEGLLRKGGEVEKRFSAIPLSIERAGTKLSDAWDAAMSGTSAVSGSTTAIAEGMERIANALPGAVSQVNALVEDLLWFLKQSGLISRTREESFTRVRNVLSGKEKGFYTPDEASAAGLAYGTGASREQLLAQLESNYAAWKQSQGMARGADGQWRMPVRVGGAAGLEKIRTGGDGTGGAAAKADTLPALSDGGFVKKSSAMPAIDEAEWFDPQEQQDRIDRIKAEADAVRASLDPMVALQQSIAEVNALTGPLGLSTDEAALAIQRMSEQALLASDTLEGGLARSLQAMEDHLSRLDFFSKDILSSVLSSFKGFVNDMLNEAMRMSVWKPLFGGLMKGLTGGLTGGGGAGGGGFGFGKIDLGGGLSLGGARAAGGPVNANVPYLVGEKGPEVFVPGSSGGIVPNGRMGQGGGMTVVQNITNRFDVGLESVDQRIRQAEPRIAKSAMKGVQEAQRRTAGRFIAS